MAKRYALGVDFGGTKMLAGIVDLDSGKLAGMGKKKTKAGQEQDLVKRLMAVIDEAADEAKVKPGDLVGIGIGAAGQVDRKKGVLLAAANIGVSQLSITKPISQKYGVPCLLANDLEIATNGELHLGAGRGCDNFVCIFVGTGIGSGIVRDGRLYRGATGTAGEIGHIVLEPTGRNCGCGATGCLEAYASRTAIAKRVVAEISRGNKSSIEDKINMSKGILRSKAIAEAVNEKDEVVTRQVKEAAEYMGLGLATVINFLNPQRIILGGGLVEEVDAYYKRAIKIARHRSLKVPAEKIEFVKAELGDNSGVIGAAYLVGDAGS